MNYLSYEDEVRMSLLQQACLDSDNVSDMRSILEKFDLETLTLMYETVTVYESGDELKSGHGSKPEQDSQDKSSTHNLRLLSKAKQTESNLIHALMGRIVDPNYVSTLLKKFAPPILDMFIRACGKKDSLALTENTVDTMINKLHDDAQLREMSIFQLFGLGFIAINKTSIYEAWKALESKAYSELDGDNSGLTTIDSRALKDIKFRFIVPDEVKAIYKSYSAAEKSQIRDLSGWYYECDIFARAASNLYGFISLDDLAENVNKIMRGVKASGSAGEDADGKTDGKADGSAVEDADGKTAGKADANEYVTAELLREALLIHGVTQQRYFVDTYKGKDYLINTSMAENTDGDEEDDGESDEESYDSEADADVTNDGKAAADEADDESEDKSAELSLTLEEIINGAYSLDKEAAEYMIGEQATKKWYIPTLHDYIMYAHREYFEETEQIEAFRKMLKPACKGYSENCERWTAKEQREDIIYLTHHYIQLSYPFETLVNVISDNHVKMDRLFGSLLDGSTSSTSASAGKSASSKRSSAHKTLTKSEETKAFNILIGAITDISNNTRMWQNRGWTPCELMEQSKGGSRSIQISMPLESGHKISINAEMDTVSATPISMKIDQSTVKAIRSGTISADEMRKWLWNADIPNSAKADMLRQVADIERSAFVLSGINSPSSSGATSGLIPDNVIASIGEVQMQGSIPAKGSPANVSILANSPMSNGSIPANAPTSANSSTAKNAPIKVVKKPGRNDPCPCGSGKKYKNCCGK